MREKLRQILHDMRMMVFTLDAMVDYLLRHDVVPVVRCGKCKHLDTETMHCNHAVGTKLPIGRKDTDFCSYGEMKEGADNA